MSLLLSEIFLTPITREM